MQPQLIILKRFIRLRQPIFKQQDRVVKRDIAGETLLVPIRNAAADMSHLFALNPVATHIWDALDGAASIDDIVASVEQRFQIDRAQAEQDARAFVDELVASQLVTRVEA